MSSLQREGGVVAEGGLPFANKWGGVLLISSVGFVTALLAYWAVCKWRQGRRSWDRLPAGSLRLAAARNSIENLELLSLLPGFDVDAAHEGFTALLAAAVQGHAAATVWLLHHGADVTAQKEDSWRDTCLHYAGGRGNLETVQALLAWGADPTAQNALGATPADVAAKARHLGVARYLREAAEGRMPANQPTKDAFIERYLGRLSSGADGKAAATNGIQQEGPAESRQLAAAEGGQAAVGGACVGEACKADSLDDKSGGSSAAREPVGASKLAAARKLAKRGFEGWGTQGTHPRMEVALYRPLAVITQVLGAVYLIWRALRSLNPGVYYAYSIPFWLAEFLAYCLSYCFFTSLWSMIERPQRSVHEMLPEGQVPHVDVFICTYSEPPEIVEPTAIAALNMNWPGSKLTVHVLDDGKRPEMAQLVRRLAAQCRYMQREAKIVYVGRDKVKGVPHHAKAGNINSCLLKEGPGKGEFIVVLDCDMVVHPDFLDRTIGHFYRQEDEPGSSSGSGSKPARGWRGWRPWCRGAKGGGAGDDKAGDDKGEAANGTSEAANGTAEEGGGGKQAGKARWVPKEKAGFIQTPQDFFNVDAKDPMVHCARFFYGPMLQGRDGIGAAPCCGTGVVFRRDVLVSIGGQSYGSITEDYNTAMSLMSAGMATMYLNERLSFGMAPDDIAGVFTQRLRWAMGALQILMKSNPMRLPGLTMVQSLLFFEAAAHHWLSISTIFMALVPIIYLFCALSPMISAHMYEFVAFFLPWYISNRIVMIVVHWGTEGGSQELWRGSQCWVWMAPNHIKAIWKVFVSESWLFKKLFNLEIGFTVTKKKAAGEEETENRWDALKEALWYTWPHLAYYVAYIAGLTFFVVKCCLGRYSTWEVMVNLAAVGWGGLVALCIWPPVATLIPRIETDLGWQIKWDIFQHLPAHSEGRRSEDLASRSLVSRLGDAFSSLSMLLPHFGPHKPEPEHAAQPAAKQEAQQAAEQAQQGEQQVQQGEQQAPPPAEKEPSHKPVHLPHHPHRHAHHAHHAQLEAITEGVAKETFSTEGTPAESQMLSGMLGATPFTALSHKSAGPDQTPHKEEAGEAHAPLDIGRSGSLPAAMPSSRRASLDRQTSMNAIGRLGLHRHTRDVLAQSALLTGMILPEREYTAPQDAVAVLLDAEGHTAPAGQGLASQSCAMSSILDDALRDFNFGSKEQGAPSSGGPTRANTLSLPTEQSMALARLQSLTGANVSLELPTSLTASSLGGRRGEASPSAGGTRQVSLIASELPSISGFVMTSHAGSSLGASAPGMPSVRLGGYPPSQAGGSQAGQADAAHQPAPTSVQLGHPPRPPTSVQAGHPPRPPTSVQLGAQPAAPTSVRLGAQPAAPTSIAFGAQPAAPTSIAFGAQPAAPTSIAFGAQPAAPTSIAFGAQPTAPTSIAFGAQPTAPTSIAFGAQPTAPTSVAFGAQPAAPTSVQLGGSGSGWAVSLFSSGGSGGGGAATNTISPFATDALSPFASSAASSVAALSKDDSGTGTPDGDEADDAALVDELAAEAAEDMGGRGAAARVREVSQQLVNIASSLSPDNASMLLQSGFSMLVPVLPTSVYEHTLVARPNFQLRKTPPSNWMFVLVNGALICAMIAGSVIEIYVKPDPYNPPVWAGGA